MKKVGCLIVTTAALLLFAALPAHAQRGGFGFSPGGGVRGGGGGGVSAGGVRGGSAGFGVPAQSSAGFAFRGRSGGFHGHGHSHGAFFVGVGVAAPVWWWGWPYYYPYYYPPYPYYPYGYYPEAQQSTVYVQQDQQAEPYYWYYCEGAQAYYPYVQQCPGGWMKVVPTPANGGPKASGPKPN